jgi:cell wall integrity and stress response component
LLWRFREFFTDDVIGGGSGFYSVYTTGLESDVSSVSASTTSSDTSATKTDGATASVSTGASGETVVVTSSSHPQASADNVEAQKKSSHNTAAIAAGVVVGVVGVAALAGAAWFFYRSKKQKAEGFRGTAGGYDRDSQPPSMSDSRFDGGYMAQRRQSNGSIDDDHDFSRRILQVRIYS